ncbi:hypothetical protein EDD15DRAFT_2369449 [Pisolithus albus]|nr:hypothetical protein EDD15DRAFT_2369449 [Pisolithus albus]
MRPNTKEDSLPTPWWEDLHGFWRTNPSYNTVFSTADPGQDFAAEAQRYFSGEKSTASKEPLPLVGDGWALGNEDAAPEEDEELEYEDKDLPGHDALEPPEVAVTPSLNADDNIDPTLHLISTSVFDSPVSVGAPVGAPVLIYSKATNSSVLSFSDALSQSVPPDVESPSTISVLNTLSSHARKDMGKTKVTTAIKSTSLNIPPHAPSSSGSSAACKQSRDAGSDISMKLTEASDTLVQQIQNSAEAKSDTKRMRIEAEVIGKELRARDKHAQREHGLKMRMVENEHELSMAGQKTKQLELELQLEQARIARLEAERRFSTGEEKN